jgi:hypothetical protein
LPLPRSVFTAVDIVCGAGSRGAPARVIDRDAPSRRGSRPSNWGCEPVLARANTSRQPLANRSRTAGNPRATRARADSELT